MGDNKEKLVQLIYNISRSKPIKYPMKNMYAIEITSTNGTSVVGGFVQYTNGDIMSRYKNYDTADEETRQDLIAQRYLHEVMDHAPKHCMLNVSVHKLSEHEVEEYYRNMLAEREGHLHKLKHRLARMEAVEDVRILRTPTK